MIFYVVSLILFLSYAILISAITIGWWRLKVFKNNMQTPEVKVSVVVAARNETANVSTLLKSLLNQNYPSELYEIIIVDDHSTDNTASLIEDSIRNKNDTINLKLITLSGNDVSGKKAALNRGILVSEGELIVVTDADCTAGNAWISATASFYQREKPQLILGPVCMADGGSFFGKLQSLEFMSLISSAAGACNAGFPILANGANIAFTRQAYESCGGFSANMQYPSGDDMFLMMSIKKTFGAGAIRFLRSGEAIVTTPATQEFNTFIQQRMRWVSKSKGYKDPMLIASSIIVFFTNGWLIFIALAALVSPVFFPFSLYFYLLKLLFDLPLMLSYRRFQRSRPLLWLFPLMELLNAFYTLCIGIAGNIWKYEWKGRKLSANSHK
jgi:cellulose synthase/poly-beta-1,6-N-acetylglucosamine synthase-like glycosyltransferase